MRRTLPIILSVFIWMIAHDVAAQIPRTISFQGVLADATGTLVPDGPQTIVLTIYDAPTGGTVLHAETQTVVVQRGVFNTMLGMTGGISPTVQFNAPYYLGIRVGEGVEMSPRTPMTAVPYALNSAMAIVADSARVSFRSINADRARVSDTANAVRGGIVTTLNGGSGAIDIVGSGATQVTRSGNQIRIHSTDSTGILVIRPSDNTLFVDDIDGPIANIKLREASVNSVHIIDGAVITPKLLDQAVTSSKIADLTIETQDIGAGVVTTEKIAVSAVATDRIANSAVTTVKIADAAVTNTKLADGSVTNSKIADAAVNSAKIADGSVATQDLADLSVTTPKLGANAVTAAKLNTEGAVAGLVLLSNGSNTPVWGSPLVANIPFDGTFNSALTLWSLTNTGSGAAGRFAVSNAASTVDALTGTTTGTGSGVYGLHSAATGTAAGVRGETQSTASNAVGVLGLVAPTSPGGFSAGVRGINNGTGGLGIGVYGSQAGSGWGVYGTAPTGIGVHGNSTDGYGIYGLSTNGTAVFGLSTNGESGRFDITNNASSSNALAANTNGSGSAASFNTSGTGNALAAATSGSGIAGTITTTGSGNALAVRINNPANTSAAATVQTNGIGSGISVQLTNASNGARGIDVLQTGVGPGVFATSAGGNAVWGITSSISAAGVIGDNTFGEAVVGRNRGGNGVGAVVGRNDSSGYGVRGFNTKDGIGVLGQTGISGGTGVGGRFENVNPANTNDALQGATNGTGWAGNFTSSNNSSGARGLRVSTTANQGGNALTVANGAISISYQNGYASGGIIDDATIVITTTGNYTLPTGAPTDDGTTVWVVNNSGGAVNVTNTTVGAFGIGAGRAQQFLFVSAVSGANWVPVQ